MIWVGAIGHRAGRSCLPNIHPVVAFISTVPSQNSREASQSISSYHRQSISFQIYLEIVGSLNEHADLTHSDSINYKQRET